MRRLLVPLVGLLLGASGASAADLAARPRVIEVQRPERVVTVTPLPSLWRGHFSGGRNADPQADFVALDWADKVEFFPDDGSCRRWINKLKAQYRTYEGFKGCIRIR